MHSIFHYETLDIHDLHETDTSSNYIILIIYVTFISCCFYVLGMLRNCHTSYIWIIDVKASKYEEIVFVLYRQDGNRSFYNWI